MGGVVNAGHSLKVNGMGEVYEREVQPAGALHFSCQRSEESVSRYQFGRLMGPYLVCNDLPRCRLSLLLFFLGRHD